MDANFVREEGSRYVHSQMELKGGGGESHHSIFSGNEDASDGEKQEDCSDSGQNAEWARLPICGMICRHDSLRSWNSSC